MSEQMGLTEDDKDVALQTDTVTWSSLQTIVEWMLFMKWQVIALVIIGC